MESHAGADGPHGLYGAVSDDGPEDHDGQHYCRKEPIGKIDVAGETTPYPYAVISERNRAIDGRSCDFAWGEDRAKYRVDGFCRFCRWRNFDARHLDGNEETFESGWLIGCDGAHSTVRHKLGMEFAGETMPSSWIIADIHLSNVPNPEEILIAWHTEGILAVFPIVAPAILRLPMWDS